MIFQPLRDMLSVTFFAFFSLHRHTHHGLFHHATFVDDVASVRLLASLPPRAERMGKPGRGSRRRTAVRTESAGAGQRENWPDLEPAAGHFARRRLRSPKRSANVQRTFS